jgi:acyl transferase domain-containing protein
LFALLPAKVSISLINGPQLCVVAGPPAAVAGFESTLNLKGIICRRVRNAHAFHSTMIEPIAQAFEAEVCKVRLGEPKIPYISNVTGTWMTRSAAANPAYWALHATRTARFSDALAQLWQFKNPILLEAGPGHTLSVLATQHPARRDGGDPITVSSIRHHYENQSDTAFLWQAIGKLWLSGAAIQWENAYRGEQRRRIPLPTYPFEGDHHWLEPLRAADATSHSPGLIRKNPNPSEWLYVPSWKRLLPMAVSDAAVESGTAAQWLVFADEAGFAPALLTRLKSAGHDAIVVNAGAGFQAVDARTFEIVPENPEHYVQLIRALQANRSLPDRILHAWSVTGLSAMEAEAGRRFTQAQVLGYYSLLFLAKTLAAHSAGHDIRLFVLSNNVHEVGGAETLFPEKSTLLGPCMVIRQEYPNIRTKAIDVDLSGDVGGHDSVAALVLGECADPNSSLCVAYRNGQRWVQTYEPVVVRKPANGGSPFRMGGVYLITGGLGNIGIAIAEWLAQKYRAKLVLIGRSNLPGKELWNTSVQSGGDSVQAKIRAIRRIENLGGDVLYVNANVADASAMRRAVEQVYQRFGALHGVIHGAGIVGDDGYQEIKDCDHAHGAAHFQAKAHGALVLEEILHDKTLDFCLLLSSLASVLGGIGQAAYASANIFLDSFARQHNRAAAVRWLSVNWDVWRVPEHGAADAISGKTLQELGMSATEAMEMMETVLAVKTASQLVVSTGDLNARIDQWIRLESLDTPQHAAAAGPVRPTLSARPAPEADHDVPRDEIEQQIARIWQDALGIDRIGIHDSFAALGGHSLLAIRIVAQLRKVFQIDLPVRALFDTPTIAALARHIEQQISAEIEALTDDEAARLVARG